ncbi:Uncharacterized protein TCM_026220 [Theobroma cacao]|uniref:Hydroxyproline-rich glycoprotein family protein n=1 Tax=Theobroma cacao TaxID=3641 RepID=A0A061F206_THECC|nr:Uncharacterized protein TCM_026220 [Theobroma cacao]
MNIGNSWLVISCVLIVGILLSHDTHMIVATESVSGSSFDGIPSHDFPSKFNVVSKEKVIKPDPPPPPPPAGGGPIQPISSNLLSSPP